MQEHDRFTMSSNLSPLPQRPNPLSPHVPHSRLNVIHFNTDVVDTPVLVPPQEPPDGAVLPEGVQQLYLSVGQGDEHHGYPVIWEVLRGSHRRPEHVPVEGDGGGQVGDRYGGVVQDT